MACGIGACLACVCHSPRTWIDHTQRDIISGVCKDGPVFLAEEVELLTSEDERIADGCMRNGK